MEPSVKDQVQITTNLPMGAMAGCGDWMACSVGTADSSFVALYEKGEFVRTFPLALPTNHLQHNVEFTTKCDMLGWIENDVIHIYDFVDKIESVFHVKSNMTIPVRLFKFTEHGLIIVQKDAHVTLYLFDGMKGFVHEQFPVMGKITSLTVMNRYFLVESESAVPVTYLFDVNNVKFPLKTYSGYKLLNVSNFTYYLLHVGTKIVYQIDIKTFNRTPVYTNVNPEYKHMITNQGHLLTLLKYEHTMWVTPTGSEKSTQIGRNVKTVTNYQYDAQHGFLWIQGLAASGRHMAIRMKMD